MFEPATSAQADEDAVFTVPDVTPPAADVMEVKTEEADIVIVLALEANPIPAPATKETLLDDPFSEKLVTAGTFAEIVMLGLVEFCESVMFDPATKDHAVEVAVTAVPLVAPPAAVVMLSGTTENVKDTPPAAIA